MRDTRMQEGPRGLRELQLRMRSALGRGKAAGPALLRGIAEAPPLAPAARLKVYADAWFYRLEEALGLGYEVTRKVLGEERFRELARAYLARHRSRDYDIERA